MKIKVTNSLGVFTSKDLKQSKHEVSKLFENIAGEHCTNLRFDTESGSVMFLKEMLKQSVIEIIE